MILQRSCTARRTRVQVRDYKGTIYFPVGSNSFKICPLSTILSLKLRKSIACPGDRYLVGTCVPLSSCKPAEPFPSPSSHRAGGSGWLCSRALSITAHISPTCPVLLSSFPMNLSEQHSMLCAMKIKDEVS